jgi:histidinol-phosphate aminotransferase
MRPFSIQSLVRPCIARLKPYSTARDEYQGELGTFLDANESPYESGYNRYPDPHQRRLKDKLSVIKQLPAENIFLGNGSDEAIDLLFRIFCNPGRDNAIAIAPSYGMYKVAADINDVEMREVPLGENFSLPVEALLRQTDTHSKLLFLCSPNNPTGNTFPKEVIQQLLDCFPGIVVVDEAYIDFSSEKSLSSELSNYPNLLILQTLSKAWGMAGLRIGLALADAQIIALMSKVKYPYNLSVATMQIAETLLTDITKQVKTICTQREIVAQQLRHHPSVRQVYPSQANFLLVQFNNPNAIYDYFIRQGIIVRNRNHVIGCNGCLRITIGLEAENRKMLNALESYEKESSLY